MQFHIFKSSLSPRPVPPRAQMHPVVQLISVATLLRGEGELVGEWASVWAGLWGMQIRSRGLQKVQGKRMNKRAEVRGEEGGRWWRTRGWEPREIEKRVWWEEGSKFGLWKVLCVCVLQYVCMCGSVTLTLPSGVGGCRDHWRFVRAAEKKHIGHLCVSAASLKCWYFDLWFWTVD